METACVRNPWAWYRNDFPSHTQGWGPSDISNSDHDLQRRSLLKRPSKGYKGYREPSSIGGKSCPLRKIVIMNL